MSKVLAWLGFAALGLASLLNVLLGSMMLIGGHLAGAIGDVAAKTDAADVAQDANHAALVAKLIALGFGVMAATEYAAGHFLKRQIKTLFVPIACGITIAGEAAFSIWTRHFNALDAVIAACCVFAFWVWYRLPAQAKPAAAY